MTWLEMREEGSSFVVGRRAKAGAILWLISLVLLLASTLAHARHHDTTRTQLHAEQSEPGPRPAHPPQAVVIFADDRVEKRAVTELAELPVSEVEAVWVWGAESPPRRLAAEQIAKGLGVERIAAELQGDAKTLEVSVQLPEGFRLPGAKAHRFEGVRLVSAPVAMWAEVPEPLLPSWAVGAAGRVAVPWAPGEVWRSRLVASRYGSWWIDSFPGSTGLGIPLANAADRALGLRGEDGEPLAGSLTVMLEERGRQRVLAQYRSEEGRPIVVPALPDLRDVVLVAGAPGFVPRGLSARPPAWPEELRLAAGSTLRGRVVDLDGEPLAGVEVEAEAWLDPALSVIVARFAVTGADGGFALGSLPRGEVALAARRPGFDELRLTRRLDVAELDLGALELAPVRSAVLVVVDDLGDPVAGATVEPSRGASTLTDARGRAPLELAAGRALGVAVEAPGHLPAQRSFTSAEELRIVLSRAFRVEGRYVDSTGSPVPEASLELRVGRSFDDRTVDPDGHFAVDLEPGARAVLTLRSASTREVVLEIEAGEPGMTRDVGDLVADQGLVARGRLVRAADGSAVARCRVWTPRAGAEGEVVAWINGNLLSAASGRDGIFELSGLARRSTLLRVDCPGLARAHLRVEPPDDGDVAELGEVVIEEGSTVRVLVGDDEAEKSTSFAVARVDLLGRWQELDMLSASVVDGEASIARVPAGHAIVTVLRDRELVCEQDIEVRRDEELEVDCRADEIEVSGRVFVGDRPAPAGRLSWLPPAPPSPSLILNSSTPLGAGRQRVFGGGRPQVDIEVDATGFFSTRALSPGRWQVVFSAREGGTTPPHPVDLAPVEAQQLELRLPAASLVGVVVGEDERPVAGARVTETPRGAFVVTGPDGGFELQGLEAGTHRLVATRGELRSEVVEVRLDPLVTPDPVTLRLAEHEEDEVEVRIVADGVPVTTGFVFVETDTGGQRLLPIQRDGRAVVRLSPPRPARLRAAAVVEDRWALGGWVDVESARRDGLTLEPAATGALELTSDEHQGAPAIVSGDGWDLSWLLTRIGARPVLRPGAPLSISGLPPGTYRIELAGATGSATVRADETATLELP